MAKQNTPAAVADQNEVELVIEDAELLTPKELEQERRAYQDEAQKRRWMADSAQQIARRVPVSVFAMGDLVAAQ